MKNDYINEIQIICDLKDIGFCNETIHKLLDNRSNIDKQMAILKKHRDYLLEDLYIFQQRIRCLDSLIYLLNYDYNYNKF